MVCEHVYMNISPPVIELATALPTMIIILHKKFVEHHVIKLILLKISKLSARLTQAIIRDKLQRLKHTQDICTRQLITMFKCARALDKSNLYCY